jgi:hypothetical protein
MAGYVWEASSGPDDVAVAEAPTGLLSLVGATTGRGRPDRGRWEPLDRGDTDPKDLAVVELLEQHFGGHDPVRMANGDIGIWRPGKNVEWPSATIGHVGPGVMVMWSTHWPPFEFKGVYDAGSLAALAGLTPTIKVRDLVALPDGYRLWRDGDDLVPAPTLPAAAYYGPIGEYLRLVEGKTEAHPAAIGASLLAQLGTLVGRRAAVRLGAITHHCNLYILKIGKTSTGAKGVADDVAGLLVTKVDPSFATRHRVGGFGSGERLISRISDDSKTDKPNEKRRVIVEPEFARILQIAHREGNILSVIIRNGFDYAPIVHDTNAHGTVISTGHHLAVLGSITAAELLKLSSELDVHNGWLNRFMFFRSAAVEVLPFGVIVDGDALEAIAAKVRAALDALDRSVLINDTAVSYHIRPDSSPVAERWDPWYHQVWAGSGTIPDLTCRQRAHVPRIMAVLAVLDRSDELTVDQFEAAKAWNDYSVASAEWVFGQGVAGKAGQLLQAIREAGASGLDGTTQVVMFKNSLNTQGVAELRADLEQRHLVVSVKVPTGGRPRLLSFAVTQEESK